VTLYEASRESTPAVAVAVVRAQRPTIRAFANAGAALDGGSDQAATAATTIARFVDRVMSSGELRRRLGLTAQSLVDDRGAIRVAHAIKELAGRPRGIREGLK